MDDAASIAALEQRVAELEALVALLAPPRPVGPPAETVDVGEPAPRPLRPSRGRCRTAGSDAAT